MRKGTSRLLASAGALLLAAAYAGAQRNPFLGRDQFPQFRQLSGLSGGGYGLDPSGWGSLSGAVAFSTPMGYGLGQDQVRLGGGSTAFSGSSFNHRETTSKLFAEYGHTFGPVAFTYSYFVKSSFGDASTNLQLSYVPKNNNEPGVSFGVQDVGGHGGSAGTNIPGDKDSSRSFFGAASYGFQTGGAPVYVSAGFGSRRFNKGFASASYQVASPFRVWAEYDGWGFNEGILLATRPHDKDEEGKPQRSFEANLLLGFIRGHYPTAALTIGF